MERTEVAAVTGPVQGGKGHAFGSPPDVERHGCVLEEFLVEGVARSYAPVSGSVVGVDGRWSVEALDTAGYRTRLYVVRPADADRFNGVVIVNWQNVTAGFDLGAPSAHELEQGYAWVGVTTQRVAVEGQPDLGFGIPGSKGLVDTDPERYGTLHHPGDAFSYDIFTQAARAVGPDRATGGLDPLGGLVPRVLIAHGGSQSAIRLGSYVNMVDDVERLFDGFFLTGHWGLCSYPPDQTVMESFTPAGGGRFAGSSAIHDRGRVPILALTGESETMFNYPVRQPDTDTFRFWEMAGTAHAGGGAAEEMEAIVARDGLSLSLATDGRNTVDWDYVRRAALEHLVAWAQGGPPPLSIPPIDIDNSARPTIRRDEVGNATGGIRLPDVVAPTAVHSGTNALNPAAALSGQSTPLTDGQLADRYPDATVYLKAWNGAVDDLVAFGLVLDRDVAGVRARGQAIAAERWEATA